MTPLASFRCVQVKCTVSNDNNTLCITAITEHSTYVSFSLTGSMVFFQSHGHERKNQAQKGQRSHDDGTRNLTIRISEDRSVSPKHVDSLSQRCHAVPSSCPDILTVGSRGERNLDVSVLESLGAYLELICKGKKCKVSL